jgi:hypothetical protein
MDLMDKMLLCKISNHSGFLILIFGRKLTRINKSRTSALISRDLRHAKETPCGFCAHLSEVYASAFWYGRSSTERQRPSVFGPSSTLEYSSEDFQRLEEILIEFDAEKGFKARNRVHDFDVVEEVASNSAVKYEDLRDI